MSVTDWLVFAAVLVAIALVVSIKIESIKLKKDLLRKTLEIEKISKELTSIISKLDENQRKSKP